MESYEEFMRVNPNKFKREERSKSPNESPVNTPRKVFSKLNSLKMSSFRSLSIQDDSHDHPPINDKSPEPDGDIPRSHSVYSIDIPNSVLLWEVDPRPENSTTYFSFTNFAMSLNEIESHMKPPKTLCPTDSRLRPDIRKLEEGDMDTAIAEKNRLEEKQRDDRRARKAKNKGVDDWQPR
jgi:oxysterol-binding protein-related protein 1/2